MNKRHKTVFITLFVLLALFQVVTTNIKYGYTFDAAEIDLQITRMNMYPYPFGKLGYLLEVKKEVQIINRFIDNFFVVVDYREYFPQRIPYLLSPFVFIGLFQFINKRKKYPLVFNSFIFTIVLLTFIGRYAKYGPVLMLFFLYCFVVLGILRVIRTTVILNLFQNLTKILN